MILDSLIELQNVGIPTSPPIHVPEVVRLARQGLHPELVAEIPLGTRLALEPDGLYDVPKEGEVLLRIPRVVPLDAILLQTQASQAVPFQSRIQLNERLDYQRLCVRRIGGLLTVRGSWRRGGGGSCRGTLSRGWRHRYAIHASG